MEMTIFESEKEQKFLSDLMKIEPFGEIFRDFCDSLGPRLSYEFAGLAIGPLREWIVDHREILFAWLADPLRKTLTRRDKLIRDFEEVLKDAKVLLVDVLRLAPIIRKADRRADLISHIGQFPLDATSVYAYKWTVDLGRILMEDSNLSEEDKTTVQDVFATQLKYLRHFREKGLDLHHLTFHQGVRNELFDREIYQGVDPKELEELSMRVSAARKSLRSAGVLLATKGALFDDRIYRWNSEKGHASHYLNSTFAGALKGECYRFIFRTPPPDSFLQTPETTLNTPKSPDRFTGNLVVDSDRPTLCVDCLENLYCSSLCPEAEISISKKEDEAEKEAFIERFRVWVQKEFNLSERTIFDFTVEGFTVEQIMGRLGKTRESIRATQKRVRKKIEKFLKSYSVEMTK